MIAPTPFLDVNVDLGDLPQNVRDIKSTVGPSPDGKTMFDHVTSAESSASDARDAMVGTATSPGIKDAILGSPTSPGIAANASEAAKAAQSLQTTFTQVIGTSGNEGTVAFNAQSTWLKLKDVNFSTFATNDDITKIQGEVCELRSLICRCWWHDVSWVYLDRAATDSAAVKVFDEVQFRDETRRAGITPERFREVCGNHGIEDFAPDDREFNKLLQLFEKFTAKPPRRAGRRSGRGS
jgi:hypothetical protein